MTTKLYTGNDTGVGFSPSTRRGAWDHIIGSTDSVLARLPRGQNSVPSQSENTATANWDELIIRYISDPLAAQTISGTLDINLLVRETDAAANMVTHIHAYITAGDTNTVRGTILTDFIDTTEWSVSATDYASVYVTGIALSSQAITAGDRIVVEIGYQAQNSVTTNYTGALKVGGSTAAATNETGQTSSSTKCGWIEFSQDLLWTYSYLYLTVTGPAVTPGAVRGTWDDSAAYDDYLLGQAPAGSRATRTKAETVVTNPYDVLAARYVSPQLTAQTISSNIVFMSSLYEAATSADAFPNIHLYVMKPDGTVRGTLITNNVGATELSALSLSKLQPAITPSSIAVTAGDRLVLEVGGRFTNVTAVSQSFTLASGGVAEVGDANSLVSAGDVLSGWLQFRQVLDFSYVPPSGLSQVVCIG